MRKVILTMCVLSLGSFAHADFIPPPPPLQKMPVELQQYLKTVSVNFNNLNVVTTTPNGNRVGKDGDVVIFNDAGTYKLFVNTDGNTTWQQL